MRKVDRPMQWDVSVRPLDPLGWTRWLTAHQVFVLASVLAISLGVVVRGMHVLAHDFPLNDGGMFYAMTADLQHAGYQLPAVTAYNQAQIPFAYSPLGFYVAAMLNDITGLSLIEVFRWLPWLITSLTVGAVWLLAQELLRSRVAVIIAVVAFGVLPRSFIWLIMGGGLTRSLGFLFTLLTLHQVLLLYRHQQTRYAVWAGVCATLTVLSHLGTVPFLVVSAALFFLFYGRHRHGLVSSLGIALATVLLTAPWWLSVFLTHGLAPFQAAQATGGSIFSAFSWQQLPVSIAHGGIGTSEPVLPVIGMLALIGGIVAVRQGYYLLPIWWLLILASDTRAGTTYATVPVALLLALGVTEMLLPILLQPQRLLPSWAGLDGPSDTGRRGGRMLHGSAPRLTVLVLAGLMSFTTASAVVSSPELGGELPVLVGLTRPERQAMRWVAQTTPAESRFLVITGNGWEVDRTSEWFPVLADRVSVATVQGYEWLPGGIFVEQRERYNQAQGCATWLAACLQDWSHETGVMFTHVYIPKLPNRECCSILRDSLYHQPEYDLVYDGPGATIFALRPGEQASH